MDELGLCGNVFIRWCYPIKRYLFVLKKMFKTKLKIQGYMASWYMYDETFGFA
jgi:hypothetical protein